MPPTMLGVQSRILVLVLLVLASATPGQTERAPWTTSRVKGQPGLPPAYVAERAFPEFTAKSSTDLAFVPGESLGLILGSFSGVRAFLTDTPSDPGFYACDSLSTNGTIRMAYSMTFHPGFPTNRLVFIAMKGARGGKPFVRVSRYPMARDGKQRLKAADETPILEWWSNGHDGCSLQFGLDGYLYVSTGDGGGPVPPDPHKTGQRLDDWMGAILRVDVDRPGQGKAYRVPPDNPFVGREGILPEIWAYGFRNPWRMGFDPRDGALWVGDVGWETWELVFRIKEGGFNGGWSLVEGPQGVHSTWPAGPTPVDPPVKAHSHSEAVSITGGVFYRGKRHPEWRDAYLYGDWGTGRIWAMHYDIHDQHIESLTELAVTPHRIVDFEVGPDGHVYYLDNHGGGIYRLQPNPNYPKDPAARQARLASFPTRLSQTGLFASTDDYQLAPGVHPYQLTASRWTGEEHQADYAMALPGRGQIKAAGDHFEVPRDAVFLRTVSRSGNGESDRFRVESQLLHFDGDYWHGYSYRWREDQSDAELVEAEGVTVSRNDDGKESRQWRFPSRSQCLRCHLGNYNSRYGNLIGLVPGQLVRPDKKRNGQTKSEWERLSALGLIANPKAAPPARRWSLADPYQDDAPLEHRARSWLHVNCGHCHRNGGTGAVLMSLHLSQSLKKSNLLDVPPARGDFQLDTARLVRPGHPEDSVLLYRIMTEGMGRMPMVGHHGMDKAGVRLLRDWICSLEEAPGLGPEDWNTEEVRRLSTTSSGAMKLALALLALPAGDERQRQWGEILQPGTVFAHDILQSYLPDHRRRDVLGDAWAESEVLSRTGDQLQGHEVFFRRLQCSQCHRVAGQGQAFGPDLSRIGRTYQATEMLRHIRRPSDRIDPQWVGRELLLTSGDSVSGLVVKRTEAHLELLTAAGQSRTIALKDIDREASLTLSLMPEGFLDTITAQEAADLLAFLGGLR